MQVSTNNDNLRWEKKIDLAPAKPAGAMHTGHPHIEVLIGTQGRTPFSDYVIQSNETGMTGAIANSCVQLLEAPSAVVLHHGGIHRLALRLSVAFSLWNELFTMSIQFLKCKLQLILSGATPGS